MNTVQCKTTGKVIELKGYVIILVETKEKKIKLYGLLDVCAIIDLSHFAEGFQGCTFSGKIYTEPLALFTARCRSRKILILRDYDAIFHDANEIFFMRQFLLDRIVQ